MSRYRRRRDEEIITVPIHLHNRTALAVCVSRSLGDQQVWLPKSLVLLGPLVEAYEPRLLRLPVWLARRKGLMPRKHRRTA